MPSLVEIGLVVLEKKIFFNFVNVLSLFNCLPLEKSRALHFNTLESTSSKAALCESLVEIGSVVLEKKIFFNFVNVFLLIRNYLPLEKGGALHLNKVESPSPKDALCQVWLK